MSSCIHFQMYMIVLRKYLLIVYMLGIHYPNFGRNLSIYVLYKNLIFFCVILFSYLSYGKLKQYQYFE